ncbi:hypoxanthine-guanine phosphoribosyltransferase [Ectothiorhodospiraceae bacterium 2226]|nr:hypoxanthine-guanine phosphoribosyltransferase [Ectothiorhodospiraceae bacterium 2226]
MAVSAQQAWAVYEAADCLYEQAQVERAFDRLAAEITARLGERDPLILCVMAGGVIPAGHLLTRLHFPLQVDYIHATRYGHRTRGGELDWRVRPTNSLQDRVVLVVDDIHDAGITLAAILEACERAGAREVYSAVLINKRREGKHPRAADFVGLETEDRYLFGYGMDYKGYLRNVPGIYAVHEDHE